MPSDRAAHINCTSAAPGFIGSCALQVGKVRQEQVLWGRELRRWEQDGHQTKQNLLGRGQLGHTSSGKGMQQGHERWYWINAQPSAGGKGIWRVTLADGKALADR